MKYIKIFTAISLVVGMTALSGCGSTYEPALTLPAARYPTDCTIDWIEESNAPDCVVEDMVNMTATAMIIEETEKETTGGDLSVNNAWSTTKGVASWMWRGITSIWE